MPQRCTVCSHSETKKIEKEIVQGRANTKIADKYGLDHQAVRYHRINHLPDKLVRSVQKKKERHAENMLDGIQDLLERTKDILDQAEEKDQKSLALKAIKEARSTYELLSKIAVKLEEYRRADERKKDQRANSQISDGLKVLSDTELKALIQLQTKVYLSNPDHELDPEARAVVHAVTQNGYASSPSDENVTRNRSRQDKNTQNHRSTDEEDSPEMIDDLTLDDLTLDDLEDDEISSEKSDPEFLKKERRRRRR